MKIRVLHNQSLLDLAIQHTGSAQNALQIAQVNGLSLTAMLIAGAEVDIPQTAKEDTAMLEFYQAKKIQPATDITYEGEAEEELEGIGYWIINKNFKVS